MNKLLKVKNVSDYSGYLGHKDTHPLISVIDYSAVSPVRHCLCNYSVFGLFLRDDVAVDLTYGFGKYDYSEGTLICVAPGQIGGKEENGELVDIKGWALLFHPDLLHGTHLEQTIKEYSFFDYRINEALHMSDEEHETFVSLLLQIRNEIENNKRDDFQNTIIIAYLEVLLNYCRRFYNRQFLTRKLENTDLLKKFESLLREYFDDGKQLSLGIPTVQYCADKLCVSANYFGDLIKKSTGETASSYIRSYIIQQAKNLLSSGESITQVAYGVGFEYPQHFSRVFFIKPRLDKVSSDNGNRRYDTNQKKDKQAYQQELLRVII